MIELVDASDPPALLPRLRRALEGDAPLHPYAGTPLPLPAHDAADLPADLALVVGTSGSTGEPKLALHGTAGLLASANATYAVLDGPGQWVLAIPPHHIAGLQVLIRSLVAGTTPVVMDRTRGFTPAAFAQATQRLGEGTAYTSLVPTQVTRLLADKVGTATLQRFSAVLVGGAAVPLALREQTGAAGVRLVATYGMSESAGGCVYDGRPLPGVEVAVDESGRIHLGGATIAHGYLGRPAEAFTRRGDVRWFATDDLGELTADGELRVHGRIDDVITTGGMKVHPRVVEEAALAAYPHLRAAVAVGIPDPEWGQLVALALVTDTAVTTDEARARLRGLLPAYALPRLVRTSATPLPERGPGKPDRRAIAVWVGQ